MKIVLYQPQIPQNTGNIVRTCSVTGCELILVRPLGFSTSNRWLKRAGLDYWDEVAISYTDNLVEYLANSTSPVFFFSSKARKVYSEVSYPKDCILVFGSETTGLPKELWETRLEDFLTLPMTKNSRCLNLSNTVSIIIYEAWKQQGFSL